jgi:hypothetical protein
VPDAELRRITVEYTIEFARVLRASSSGASFSFLSGNGPDPTGRSRIPFARYKGEAEKEFLAAGFPHVYIFRPAYIYPVEPRKEPNFSYRLLRTIYPAFRVLFPNQVIRSDDLARAMVDVAVRRTDDRGDWLSRTVTSETWSSRVLQRRCKILCEEEPLKMEMTRRQLALSMTAAATLRSSLFETLSPLGVPRGVVPGRFTWVHDPAAVTWDGPGSWWTDANNNPSVIDAMVSRSIRGLTNQKSDAEAWSFIFHYFNHAHGRGKAAYKAGENFSRSEVRNTLDQLLLSGEVRNGCSFDRC